MKLRIVAVGAIKERAARALVDEYLGRIKRYCAVEEIEIKPGKRELESLRKAIADTTVVAMDVEGQALSSKQLARQVEQLASRGKGVVSFVIGGADGLPKRIVDDAFARWSLSKLTFPHRLARVILAEQLYRSLSILRGEPYDR